MQTQIGLIRMVRLRPMQQANLDAFSDRWPWVEKYVRKNAFNQAYVTGVEPEILDYQIQSHTYFPAHSTETEVFECFWFLDKDGELVTRKRVRTIQTKKFFGFFGPLVPSIVIDEFTGCMAAEKSVAETLDFLGEKAKRVHYFMSFFERTKAVIVFKTPRGIPVMECIGMQRKAIEEELDRQCRLIDERVDVQK